MNPEAGHAALASSKRLVTGLVTFGVGLVGVVVGLFVHPGGTAATLGLAGLGTILLFIGVASLSTTIAKRASLILGAPISRLFRLPGELATQNAARAPRRTSSTASALMIGLALVSAFSVVAGSVKSTFSNTLKRSVQADYFMSSDTFQGFSPQFADGLKTIPQLDAVSAMRFTSAQVDNSTKNVTAVDPTTFSKLVNLDVKSGSVEALASGGVLVHHDPAKSLKLKVGDPIAITWQNGRTASLKVAGTFNDNTVTGSWVVSLDTLAASSDTADQRDRFVAAKLRPGADATVARAAIDKLGVTFPQVKIEDRSQFRRSQEGQINQLVTVVNGMLLLAILIAVLGIANTLALSVFERTREFGLLRAVGMSRRQLRRTVRWEAVIVALFGAILGIVIGTPLGAALASALPKSFVDGVTVPVGQLAGLLVVAVIAGLVAAILPARRASKLNVLDAIAHV
jgi:putative ABC transport system permease protein